MRKIENFDYTNKKILLRVDLNVPVSNGLILDDTRINKIIPTIQYLLKQNAKIIIASHFGRPKGEIDPKFSLRFLVPELEKRLGRKVSFADSLSSLNSEEIILLENLRFFAGETKNDSEFARQLASLADFYINDAFSCSHRSHASIEAITKFLPSAAGLLLQEEIESLSQHLNDSAKPIIAIVGGSKISTKLSLLNNLATKVDYLAIGGAMANSFLKVMGYEIGNSFYEPDLLQQAKEIMDKNCKIILPQDVVIAKEIASNIKNQIVDVANVPQDQMILDLGPETVVYVQSILKKCKTVIMNGPLGVFENFPFSGATLTIARSIAKLTKQNKLVSVAGGGDIVAALSKAGLFEEFTYVSTAGGAFLEWLEGKDLPGIKALC